MRNSSESMFFGEELTPSVKVFPLFFVLDDILAPY